MHACLSVQCFVARTQRVHSMSTLQRGAGDVLGSRSHYVYFAPRPLQPTQSLTSPGFAALGQCRRMLSVESHQPYIPPKYWCTRVRSRSVLPWLTQTGDSCSVSTKGCWLALPCCQEAGRWAGRVPAPCSRWAVFLAVEESITSGWWHLFSECVFFVFFFVRPHRIAETFEIITE